MMKDIMVGSKKFPKIGAFTEVSAFLALSFCYILLTNCHGKAMKIISGITTYFSYSNHGTHHLKEEMKKETDKHGIEIVGVTRFSMFSIHASSIAYTRRANITCSDIFNIWIGIAIGYNNVFADASKSHLYHLQRQVYTFKIS